MAFYPCLSKKKAFPGLPQALPKWPRASEALKSSETYQHRTVFLWTSASFQYRKKPGARAGLSVHLQWVALWACSRWAVPPACRAKGYFEAPWLGFLALRGIENASQTLSARSRLLGRSLGTCTDRYPADAGEEPLMSMLMLGSVLMNYMVLAC